MTTRTRTTKPCGCGCGQMTRRRQNIYASAECAVRARVAKAAAAPRPSKVCQYAPCGATYTKPPKLDETRWGERKFCCRAHKDAAQVLSKSPTATGQPGAARAGNRRPPRPVPSRDRRPVKPAVTVFGDAPPEEPFRPGRVPVVEPVRRTVPRPSFGLTRRSA